MKSRESRKLDHIKYALHLEDGPCATGFSDMRVLHNCLPQVDRRQVSLTTELTGIGKLEHPIIINAITGGAPQVQAINEKLAVVARETHCAMAVGSQYGAVRKGQYAETFSIVRKTYPEGILFANVSALASVEEAQRAVDMIGAQALQVHLNPAQELAMEEGDRDFTGWLRQIEAICKGVSVPVIVKETGCGMAAQQARQLIGCGVSILDTGGAGGTNFPAIELCRHPQANRELAQWGIPSALALLEVRAAKGWQQGIIGSGGIRTALDVFKAQVLGANAVGMAGNILQKLQQEGVEGTVRWIRQCLESVKDFYTLSGCNTVQELRQVRYYFTGELADAYRFFAYTK